MISLILLAVVGFAASAPTSDELLSVNVVIRHGDRAATNGWATPQSPAVFFRGNGELSDDGIDNAHAQGEDFQERYEKSGFIDRRFLPTQVYVRASSVDRVLMSAASFTNALFRETDKRHVVIPPIYTKPETEDGLLVALLTCTDGWDDVIAKYNLPSNETVYSSVAGAMIMTEWPASCSTVDPSLFDAIVSEYPNKKIKMPVNYQKCAKGPAREFMYKYLETLAGAGNSFNEVRIKRAAGVLTTELLDNFVAASNCTTAPCAGQPKMRIYYTHDVNVLALAHVFGVLDEFKGINPSFSSALVFETRRNAKGSYVRIFLKDGQDAKFVATRNCASDCSLPAVAAAVSQFAITSQILCADD